MSSKKKSKFANIFLKGIRVYNNVKNFGKKHLVKKKVSIYCLNKIFIYYDNKDKKVDEYLLNIKDNNFKKVNNIIDTLLKIKDIDYIKIEYDYKENCYFNILTGNNIKENKLYFPPYQEEINELQETSIISATYGKKDLTKELIKYAGPKGNFYKDIELEINVFHLTNNKNKPILDFKENKDKLIILDSNLEEKEYKNNNDKL